MLHAAMGYGMARYRLERMTVWCVSGLFSAVGVFVMGSRGLWPDGTVVFALSKTSKSQGMGAGLWLNSSIVTSHGGHWGFEREAGLRYSC
jgi:hypothetical protein